MKFTVKRVLFVLSNVWAMCVGAGLFGRLEFSLNALPFRYHGIVPEFVHETPKQLLEVSFSGFEVNLGNRATASQVTPQPKVHWDCDPNALYTLIMFDCDPLGRKTKLLSEVSHWMVGNIRDCDIFKGQVLSDWYAPSPPIDTDFHRYVFLLFEQNSNITFEEPFIRNTLMEGRAYTTAIKFIRKYDLGRAKAGNFFLGEHDWRTDTTFAALEPLPEYVHNAIKQVALKRDQDKE